MESHGPDADRGYATLRARLEEMGYLSRPLDRFVLTGATRPGSFLRRHAGVSARVALASGPLLGLLFAIAVVAMDRSAFSRPLDFLLLSFYYSIAFAAAILVLELIAGLALAAWVRWRGRGVGAFQATAARAGFAVSLLVSAYLALWWKRRSGGEHGLLVDAVGLVALVLVNGALLRVSSLASLAALVRVSDLPGAPDAAARAPGPGLRTLGGIAALLLIAGFFLAPGSPRRAAAGSFSRIPVAGRLVVLAWDGVPEAQARQLLAGAAGAPGAPGISDLPGQPGRNGVGSASPAIDAGAEAALSAGAGGGAAAPSSGATPGAEPPTFVARLEPPPAGRSLSRPSFWTIVATGRALSQIGVSGVEERQGIGLSSPLGGDLPLSAVLRALVPGRDVAVSARTRRARSLWEILGEKEGTGVIGWWATWPAPDAPLGGPARVVVTDRALFSLRPGPAGAHRVAPASLAASLASTIDADLRAAGDEASAALGGLDRAPGLEQAALIDGYGAMIAGRVLKDPSIRDLWVYMPGLDILRTQAAPSAEVSPGGPSASRPEAAPMAAVEGTSRGSARPAGTEEAGKDGPPPDAIQAFAAYDRGLIRRIGSALDRDDWLVLIVDPGRQGEPGKGTTGSGWVIIRGPGVRPLLPEAAPVAAAESWTLFDLAPTLLNLRGFPKSRTMPGSARISFLQPDWASRLTPREIDSFGDYAPPEIPASGAPESEEEILERLRSLGYVN